MTDLLAGKALTLPDFEIETAADAGQKLLFVNCTMRECSRTEALARRFLSEYALFHPSVLISELFAGDRAALTPEKLDERSRLLLCGATDEPVFADAKALLDADMVVIAAPFWDLSFPAALRAWIESVCVEGMTFSYDDGGIPRGACRARSLVYVTTRGGVYSSPAMASYEFAVPYIRAIFSVLGIYDVRVLAAEGLDIHENDAEAIMNAAFREADRLAAEL